MDVRYKVAEECAGHGQGPDDVALVAPVLQVDQPLSQLTQLQYNNNQLVILCIYSLRLTKALIS